MINKPKRIDFRYLEDGEEEKPEYLDVPVSQNNFTARGTKDYSRLVTNRAPTIQDSHGVHYDPSSQKLPLLYSNINYGDEATQCCHCQKEINKTYFRTRDKFKAESAFKDHPIFHSIDSYQTCSCKTNGVKKNKQDTFYQQLQRMEPYTKAYNDTYLDYMKGKPVPRPVTPPEVKEDDDDSVNCEHHDHVSLRAQTELENQMKEDYQPSKGQPKIENVKTALEVPPISGIDYTNPNASRDSDIISGGMLSPGKSLKSRNTINTGLPDGAPGHDSVLLSLSRTMTSQKDGSGEENTGNKYKIGKSISQKLKTVTEFDSYAFKSDMYNQPSFNSVFMCLYGELALRYHMTQIRVEKFNVIDSLSAQDASYVQINQDKMFVSGGSQRGTKQIISNQAALFDFDVRTFSNLPQMIVPKYRHGLGVMDTSVYCIGGGVDGSIDTNSVERYDFKYQEWYLCRSMKYPRVLPTILSSRTTKKLYVFGGASKKNDNMLIETYSCPSDKWKTLGVVLPIPFSNVSSFAILIPAFSLSNSTIRNYDNSINSSDEDDKIIVLYFGLISREPPKMYLINLTTHQISEIEYDKDNSEFGCERVRMVVYDDSAQMIIAYSQINYHDFDYMALNTEPLRWKSSSIIIEQAV